jgi:hypothetical protein
MYIKTNELRKIVENKGTVERTYMKFSVPWGIQSGCRGGSYKSGKKTGHYVDSEINYGTDMNAVWSFYHDVHFYNYVSQFIPCIVLSFVI